MEAELDFFSAFLNFRAIIPTQSNLLEFGADCDREDENEWHYSISAEDNSKRNQPVSFKKVFLVSFIYLFIFLI